MVSILSKFTVLYLSSYFVVDFLELKLILFYNRTVYYYTRIFLILNIIANQAHLDLSRFFFSKIGLIRLKNVLKLILYFATAPCNKGMNSILPIPYFASAPSIANDLFIYL